MHACLIWAQPGYAVLSPFSSNHAILCLHSFVSILFSFCLSLGLTTHTHTHIIEDLGVIKYEKEMVQVLCNHHIEHSHTTLNLGGWYQPLFMKCTGLPTLLTVDIKIDCHEHSFGPFDCHFLQLMYSTVLSIISVTPHLAHVSVTQNTSWGSMDTPFWFYNIIACVNLYYQGKCIDLFFFPTLKDRPNPYDKKDNLTHIAEAAQKTLLANWCLQWHSFMIERENYYLPWNYFQ